jgi:hypothetical protein
MLVTEAQILDKPFREDSTFPFLCVLDVEELHFPFLFAPITYSGYEVTCQTHL